MRLEEKIKSREEATAVCSDWQRTGQHVVFTNGCFDLLHAGHALFLEEAAGLGDKLVIGLNDDTSVSRLKGPHRPIQHQDARAIMLAALEAVDMVVLFPQDTPLELITALRPDTLVKGGDYSPDQIVGADVVSENGGRVKSLAFHTGYSTSAIENRILEMYKDKRPGK